MIGYNNKNMRIKQALFISIVRVGVSPSPEDLVRENI